MTRRFLASLLAGALGTAQLLVAVTSPVISVQTSNRSAVTSPVISVQGTSLLVNGVPGPLLGMNARTIASLAGATSSCSSPLSDQQLNSLFAALPTGSTIRFEAFQGGYATNPTTHQLDFSGIDRVMSMAAAHGDTLIAVLASQWGNCDDGTEKDLAWYKSGFRSPASPTLAQQSSIPAPSLSYADYVKAFAQRYATNPALAMYEPIGEPDAAACLGTRIVDNCSVPRHCNEPLAAATLRSFYDTVGTIIRAADPRHLIEAGFGGNTSCGIQGDDLTLVARSPGIDVLSFHDYHNAIPLTTLPASMSPVDEIARAKTVNKPIIDAETGIESSSSGDPGCASPTLRAQELLHREQTQLAAGVAGFIVWNLQIARESPDCTLSIPVGDPVLAMLFHTQSAPSPYAVLNGSNFSHQVLDAQDFTGASFIGANLAGTSFKNANLSLANLSGANVSRTDLRTANLAGVLATHLQGTPLLPPGYQILDATIVGPGVALNGVNFTSANLSHVALPGADLSGATLSGANVQGLDLRTTQLFGVTARSLVGTPLLPSTIGWASNDIIAPFSDLTNAVFTAGSLAGADLHATDLSGADLHLLDLTGVRSGGVHSWMPTQLPPGYQIIEGSILGPAANLTDITLSGLSLTGVDLHAATLTGATGRRLSGTPNLPPGWGIQRGNLLGPGANLQWVSFAGQNLSGQNLAGANLYAANFVNTNLTGADLRGANLQRTDPRNLTGCPLLSPGTLCRGGLLLGPGINLAWVQLGAVSLAGVDLSGADLTGAALTGTDLADGNLAAALLTHVNGSHLSGTPQLPPHWRIINGLLIGPSAQLQWRDLSHTDLSNSDLAGADLTGTNLSSSNLAGADLSTTTLLHANITGADFTGAQMAGVAPGEVTGTPRALPPPWRVVNGVLQPF